MQCFKGKINIFVKEKALKLNIYSSYFKAYSTSMPINPRTRLPFTWMLLVASTL